MSGVMVRFRYRMTTNRNDFAKGDFPSRHELNIYSAQQIRGEKSRSPRSEYRQVFLLSLSIFFHFGFREPLGARFSNNDELITNALSQACVALELPKVILVKKKDYCAPRTSGLFIRVISSPKRPRAAAPQLQLQLQCSRRDLRAMIIPAAWAPRS